MPQPRITKEVAQHALDILEAHGGNRTKAARALGISRSTFFDRINKATTEYRLKALADPSIPTPSSTDVLRRQMDRISKESDALRKENKRLREGQLSAELVREIISGSNVIPNPPDWFIEREHQSNHGVPTLLCSDWHWGETVEARQVNYVNAFNKDIAERRWKRMVEKTINLMLVHMAKPKYDYLCFPLLGDMLSGNIHEELRENNWAPISICIIEFRDMLIWAIDEFLNAFKKVYLPCVTGNHGRMDRKPRYKNATYDNYEFILYEMLRHHYKGNKAVHFEVADSSELLYQVCNTRYLAVHGDGFKGGSGIAGALSPMMIGRARKKESAMATNRPFDCMVHGHWHFYRNIGDIISNGCFPPGEMVTVADGTRKPIETIQIGEMVVSRTGLHKVYQVIPKQHKGTLTVIRCGTDFQQLRCTPNHEIYAIKGQQLAPWKKGNAQAGQGSYCPEPEWIRAEHLGIGDYAQIGMLTGDEQGIDEDTAWLLGMYLAEGSVSGPKGQIQHVDFTHHIRETAYSSRVVLAIKKLWPDVHVKESERPSHNSRAVVVSRQSVAQWFLELCGKGCRVKRIHERLMTLAPSIQIHMLLGWLQGDGHVRPQHYRGGRHVSGTSVSRHLIEQMQQIALRCGFDPTVYMQRPGGPRLSTSYSLAFSGDSATRICDLLNAPRPSIARDIGWSCIEVAGRKYAKITSIWRDPYIGEVYDLSVDGDPSYTVNGFTVHNSGKGFDDYALKNSFQYQAPIQALWVTHPDYGITASWPVYLEAKGERYR